MDYEEQYYELETVRRCEECDWHEQQIHDLTIQMREAEGGTELQYNTGKRLLDSAVQAQLRHVREHELEEESLEN
jgi:hypothetical protein